MVFSDALVEHFTQVRYRFVWNILLLLFQMMITLRKVSPLSIQGDMSMHSAWSFHRRKCNPTALKMNTFLCFLGDIRSIKNNHFFPLLFPVSFTDLWLPLLKGSMAVCATG